MKRVVELLRMKARVYKMGKKARRKRMLNVLMDLLNIYSPSEKEGRVAEYIKPRLVDLGFDVMEDEVGNIYAVRGVATRYPLLNAHMDCVGAWTASTYGWNASSWERGLYSLDCGDGWVYNHATRTWSKPSETIAPISTPSEAGVCDADCLSCVDKKYCYGDLVDASDEAIVRDIVAQGVACDYYIPENASTETDIPSSGAAAEGDIAGEGEYDGEYDGVAVHDKVSGKITSDGTRPIGGDDKCGIAIALRAAAESPSTPMKLLFTVQEECGCVGVRHFVGQPYGKDFLRDVKYSVTIDRRGADNLIYNGAGTPYCSSKFAGRLVGVGLEGGLEVAVQQGSVSDAGVLTKHVPEAVNISAGYYDAHTDNEYVVVDEVLAIKDWVTRIMGGI